MNALPWALAVLLTIGVGGLAVVPWVRSSPESLGGHVDPVAIEHVEQALERRFCLECGERWDDDDAATCSGCGAPRPRGASR